MVIMTTQYAMVVRLSFFTRVRSGTATVEKNWRMLDSFG